MSCKVTPSTSPEDKIQILMGNEAMNRYRQDHYGMNTCRIGYDYMYLADMAFLLKMTSCAEESCHCYCQCSYTRVKEKINML